MPCPLGENPKVIANRTSTVVGRRGTIRYLTGERAGHPKNTGCPVMGSRCSPDGFWVPSACPKHPDTEPPLENGGTALNGEGSRVWRTGATRTWTFQPSTPIGLGVIYPGFPVLQLVQQSWLTIDGRIDVAWYSKFLGLKIS